MWSDEKGNSCHQPDKLKPTSYYSSSQLGLRWSCSRRLQMQVNAYVMLFIYELSRLIHSLLLNYTGIAGAS